MTKEGTEVAVNEIEEMIRCEENYIVGTNGIKEITILNDLNFFKAYKNFSADKTHDLFLGIFKIDINDIIYYLHNEHNITANDINEFINEFDWGKKAKENRPVEIKINQIIHKNFALYARECWEFVSMLLFFIRYFLPANDQIFLFATIVVDLLDTLLMPSYNNESLQLLSNIFSLHHTRRIELFGPLTPKMHFLTHYPRLIRLCGPLKFIWCFAMERKHQDIKQYCTISQNRKNLPLSVSKKIAMQESILIVKNENIFKKIGRCSKTIINQDYYFLLENSQNFHCVKYADYKGLNYTINDFILNETRASVDKIKEIYINVEDDQMIIITETFNSEYVEEMRSYKILGSTNVINIFNVEHFIYPPVNKHSFFGEDFIRIKYF